MKKGSISPSSRLPPLKNLISENICDLLREKGPTAVKRRFKTQLTGFCRKLLCNIFTSAS